jgi:hypothetical protein
MQLEYLITNNNNCDNRIRCLLLIFIIKIMTYYIILSTNSNNIL